MERERQGERNEERAPHVQRPHRQDQAITLRETAGRDQRRHQRDAACSALCHASPSVHRRMRLPVSTHFRSIPSASRRWSRACGLPQRDRPDPDGGGAVRGAHVLHSARPGARASMRCLRPLVRGLERLRIPTAVGAAIIVLGAVAVGVTAAWCSPDPSPRGRESSTSFANARTKLSDIVRPLDRLTDAAVGAHDPPRLPRPHRCDTRTAAARSTPRRSDDAGNSVWRGHRLLYSHAGRSLRRAASELLPDTESIVARYLGLSAVINCLRRNRRRNRHVGNRIPDPWCGVADVPPWSSFPTSAPRRWWDSFTINRPYDVFRSFAARCLRPSATSPSRWAQNNVVSPFVYAGRLKLNPLGLVCVLFGWFIWGCAACSSQSRSPPPLKALGDQVPRLAPLGELLGA